MLVRAGVPLPLVKLIVEDAAAKTLGVSQVGLVTPESEIVQTANLEPEEMPVPLRVRLTVPALLIKDWE
jgi:hypothetical protein